MTRIGIVYGIALVGVLMILGKVLYLQLVEGEKWRAEAEKVFMQQRVIPATRGDILSYDGRPLASSIPSFTLAIDPNSTGMDAAVFNAELPGLALELSRMFGDESAKAYESKIRNARNKGSRYQVLHRKVSYLDAQLIKEFPLFKYGQYQGGLILEQENSRVTPYELLAKRTIGYISRSEEGPTVGVEGAFDSYLKGRDGLRNLHRIRGGEWVPLSTENEVDPKDGFDVVTTLNIEYQDVAESALYELLKVHNAHHGCAVLMEVQTGAIRAMANLGREDGEEGEYYESKNYAIWERTEPGSTFKLPALMAALEDGYIKLSDTINTFRGVYAFHDQKITDSHTGGFGMLTVAEVFEKSSNIGMARLIDQHYRQNPSRFTSRLFAMGLTNPTQIEIAGEQDPYIKTPDDASWTLVSLPFMAHGYELLMTPLQTLAFYNAVANKGRYVKPRLVEGLKNHSHLVKAYEPEVVKHSICSSETLEIAHKMLEGVVERGTATNLKSEYYTIAGKTGTAVIAQGDQGYKGSDGKKQYRASFVGYFPADAPKYSCIVVITRPNMGEYYGNKVAGTVFRAIADRVMATDIELSGRKNMLANDEGSVYYPIPNPGDYKGLETIASELNLPVSKIGKVKSYATINLEGDKIRIEDLEWRQGTVPDVTGMGLKDALPLLENEGFKVVVNGFGKVITQSLEAGAEVAPGSTIYLELATE